MRQKTGHGLVIGLLLAAIAGAPGCASEETIKKAKGHYQEGLAHLERDRQQAFVSFQKAVQLNPKHKEAHYSLGHLYAVQGKYKQAEQEFREATQIDPDYAEAHNYLGQVLERQNRWTEAIRQYREALSNPLYATPDLAWFNLGRALAHEGNLEPAAQALEDAMLITPPTVPPAVLNLELARVYLKLGYQSKAHETLDRVKMLDAGGPYGAQADKLKEGLNP